MCAYPIIGLSFVRVGTPRATFVPSVYHWSGLHATFWMGPVHCTLEILLSVLDSVLWDVNYVGFSSVVVRIWCGRLLHGFAVRICCGRLECVWIWLCCLLVRRFVMVACCGVACKAASSAVVVAGGACAQSSRITSRSTATLPFGSRSMGHCLELPGWWRPVVIEVEVTSVLIAPLMCAATFNARSSYTWPASV
jgi:hypothetical protein